MNQGWLVWHSGERPRKLNVLLLCPMWSPLSSECCHIRPCWSGPARGQKAEMGWSEAHNQLIEHPRTLVKLAWRKGGPFPKLHNSTLGPVLVILDGFPVPTLLFSRKEKQGGQISLKSTFHKLNRVTFAFVPLFRTQDTWPLQGRLRSVIFILGCCG